MRLRNRLLLSLAVASSLLVHPDAFAQSNVLARNECLPSSPFPCSTAEDEGLDPFVIEAFMNDVTWWVEQGRIVGGELLLIVNGRVVPGTRPSGGATASGGDPWSATRSTGCAP